MDERLADDRVATPSSKIFAAPVDLIAIARTDYRAATPISEIFSGTATTLSQAKRGWLGFSFTIFRDFDDGFLMGLRRKARECALQMLFAADIARTRADELVRTYWAELGEPELDDEARDFATRLVMGVLAHLPELDERIRRRAEHWRIERMAVVDRNILRLAVYEFLYEPTPRAVVINEALEIARRFSTYEATQFINGILDAIRRDLDLEQPRPDEPDTEDGERFASA
ncbi:transcription antitermination factor NusB [Pyrinomonas sp.]|uniref:transcription antitermination factor NusB n=1 Tax=Pyrinomonas sp. TaxID=2080306 RepID=UPI0033285C8C